MVRILWYFYQKGSLLKLIFFNRDTLLWVKAVDLMRSLKPESLVPQHTRPLEGSELIMETLTAYRDAIQFVHDQTVRYMNKGMLLLPIGRL